LGAIQLATGNLEFNEKAFFKILQEDATDIIQPEIQWCGGLTAFAPYRRESEDAKSSLT